MLFWNLNNLVENLTVNKWKVQVHPVLRKIHLIKEITQNSRLSLVFKSIWLTSFIGFYFVNFIHHHKCDLGTDSTVGWTAYRHQCAWTLNIWVFANHKTFPYFIFWILQIFHFKIYSMPSRGTAEREYWTYLGLQNTFHRWCGRQNDFLRSLHSKSPEAVTMLHYVQRDFADVIKVMDLKMGRLSWIPSWVPSNYKSH